LGEYSFSFGNVPRLFGGQGWVARRILRALVGLEGTFDFDFDLFMVDFFQFQG